MAKRGPMSAAAKAKLSASLKAYYKAHPRKKGAKRNKRKTTSSRSASLRMSNGRIRVFQATVDLLNKGRMADNIRKANSGKMSAQFVEAARRFYPGKIHPKISKKG